MKIYNLKKKKELVNLYCSDYKTLNMMSTIIHRIAGTVLSAAMLSIATASVDSNFTNNGCKMLYDFRTEKNLDNWWESSDTVRTPGMSKASFVLQKSRLFQRAVLFTMLNPQPNGAGFAGYNTEGHWNLSKQSVLELHIRAQGQSEHYKVNLRHKGQDVSDGAYEMFFKVNKDEFQTIQLPLADFKFYYRGHLQPDAEDLDKSNITSLGIQVPGGVYSDWKQSGASSLEIDYIQAI